MKRINFLRISKGKVSLGLEVIIFKEEKQFIAYCPALELSAYGDNDKDVRIAFEETLNIFLDYTAKKGTLEKELIRIGWKKQPRKRHEFLPPEIEELKNSDPYLNEIITTKKTNTIHQDLAVTF